MVKCNRRTAGYCIKQYPCGNNKFDDPVVNSHLLDNKEV
jgi:hypothetical protein